MATGLVPLQMAKLLGELKQRAQCLPQTVAGPPTPSAAQVATPPAAAQALFAAWEAGFSAYCTQRAEVVSEDLAAFCDSKDPTLPAARCLALLNACGASPSLYRAKRELIDWRYFSVAGGNLDTLRPMPSSELVRRVAWLVALEREESHNASQRKTEIQALLRYPELPPPSAGFGVEHAVLSALGLERRLPTELLPSMCLPLPHSHKGNHVKLAMERFSQPPLAHPTDVARLLVPLDFNYSHVDGVIVYQCHAGTWIVVGVQVTSKTVQQHLVSLQFITGGHWKAFVPQSSTAETMCALLWITPEVEPVLPELAGGTQGHLSLELFKDWVGSLAAYVSVFRV